MQRDRLEFLPYIKDTLEHSDIVIKDKENAIIFAKDIGQTSYFTSVSKNNNGEWIISTNSYKTLSQLKNRVNDNGEILYISKEVPNILAETFTTKAFSNELASDIIPQNPTKAQSEYFNPFMNEYEKIKEIKKLHTQDDNLIRVMKVQGRNDYIEPLSNMSVSKEYLQKQTAQSLKEQITQAILGNQTQLKTLQQGYNTYHLSPFQKEVLESALDIANNPTKLKEYKLQGLQKQLDNLNSNEAYHIEKGREYDKARYAKDRQELEKEISALKGESSLDDLFKELKSKIDSLPEKQVDNALAFIDSYGVKYHIPKDTADLWLKTFNLKSLDEAYIPSFTPEVKQALDSILQGEQIKLYAGSLVKLIKENRLKYLDRIKPTLEQPQRIILQNDGALIFARNFGEEKYFTSVARNDNGEWIVRSNAPKAENGLNNKISAGGKEIYNSQAVNQINAHNPYDDIAKSNIKLDSDIIPQTTLNGDSITNPDISYAIKNENITKELVEKIANGEIDNIRKRGDINIADVSYYDKDNMTMYSANIGNYIDDDLGMKGDRFFLNNINKNEFYIPPTKSLQDFKEQSLNQIEFLKKAIKTEIDNVRDEKELHKNIREINFKARENAERRLFDDALYKEQTQAREFYTTQYDEAMQEMQNYYDKKFTNILNEIDFNVPTKQAKTQMPKDNPQLVALQTKIQEVKEFIAKSRNPDKEYLHHAFKPDEIIQLEKQYFNQAMPQEYKELIQDFPRLYEQSLANELKTYAKDTDTIQEVTTQLLNDFKDKPFKNTAKHAELLLFNTLRDKAQELGFKELDINKPSFKVAFGKFQTKLKKGDIQDLSEHIATSSLRKNRLRIEQTLNIKPLAEFGYTLFFELGGGVGKLTTNPTTLSQNAPLGGMVKVLLGYRYYF